VVIGRGGVGSWSWHIVRGNELCRLKSHVGSAAIILSLPITSKWASCNCYSEFQTRVLLQVAIPTNQFLKQEAWLSEMLSRSRSSHLSCRNGVPGFDVLAQPLSTRQKLDSFLFHGVFCTTHVDSAMCNKTLTRPESACWWAIFMSLRVLICQLDGRDSFLVSYLAPDWRRERWALVSRTRQRL